MFVLVRSRFHTTILIIFSVSTFILKDETIISLRDVDWAMVELRSIHCRITELPPFHSLKIGSGANVALY